MTFRTLTHAELQISPLNVRKKLKPVDALADNIAARGVMLPLIVHPMALVEQLHPDWGDQGGNAGAPFGVYAGGRRWRAVGKLIAEGRWPADRTIECVVREFDPASITDESLAENLIRQDLDAWEVHSAIAHSVEQGHSVEQIAETLGQDVKWVRQQLRLGTLIPEIFSAYAENRISVDQAQAFAATEDRELQGLAWEHFQRSREHDRYPADIRAFFKIGDRELEKLLRFVGEDAYRAAGGWLETDLFDERRTRIADDTLLRQLAEQRLEDHRALERQLSGREDLRFAKAPPDNAGTTDWSLRVDPLRKRGKLVLPAGDVVATLAIGDNGEVETSYWYESRKAKAAATKAETEARAKGAAPSADHAPPAEIRMGITGGKPIADDAAFEASSYYAQAGRQVVKEKYGFTAEGLEIVRSLRRALLRGLLVGQHAWTRPEGSGLARDYLIWSGCRQEFGNDKHTVTGARGLGDNWAYRDSEAPVVREFITDELADRKWNALVADFCTWPFMAEEDPAESLTLFVALDEDEKNLAAALLAGQALVRSANVPGWRVRAHDRLAELAGGSDKVLRQNWTPNAAFLGLLPKLRRLELAQPHVDPEAFRTWHKQDDRTITGACAGALELVEDWVHPLLSFNVDRAAAHREPVEGEDGEERPAEQDPAVNDALQAEPAE